MVKNFKAYQPTLICLAKKIPRRDYLYFKPTLGDNNRPTNAVKLCTQSLPCVRVAECPLLTKQKQQHMLNELTIVRCQCLFSYFQT